MKLYIIPTPIGNLEDITLRAIRMLGEVDAVLAEDTRVSGKLMKHLGIEKKLIAFHAFNEHKSLESIIGMLKQGQTLGLVSDAGTPGISDPAFLLVRECIRSGIPVECLPGPVAFVPALVQSGIPGDRFLFIGFLPVKKGRQTALRELEEEAQTLIFYESPFRLIKTLEDLAGHLGPERNACVCRELTKLYEETARGTLAELIRHFTSKTIKGEIVIIVEGKITSKKHERE